MHRLTKRERDVVRELAKGLTNKEIGDNIGVTEGTVKMMLQHIYTKLGVRNRLKVIVLVHNLTKDADLWK